MKTAIYLRKSRQDEELEKRENTDTLARHRTTLLDIARKQHLDILEIKEEIVSGGSIASRPKMLELLNEINENNYDAVLCMDLDRLGRGGMQDQGLILDTFKESNTLIITPDKTYNLNDDLDEEMTEFKSFFARRELKMITKRMQRGREKSVLDGKFIASSAPFGYKFEYDINGKRMLVIDESKAGIVKEIFALYAGGFGAHKIKSYLDSIGVKTATNINFTEQAVRRLLKNDIYAGFVTWNKVKRKGTKSVINDKDKIIRCKGQHEAIVSEEMFNLVQDMIRGKYCTSTSNEKQLKNMLAGLAKCSHCGHTMIISQSNNKNGSVTFLKCTYCKNNAASKLELVEKAVLEYLEQFLYKYEKEILNNEIENNSNNRVDNLLHSQSLLENEHETLLKQRSSLHDFLEQGIYEIDTYKERNNILRSKIEENQNAINNIKELIENENKLNLTYYELIPKIEEIIKAYNNTENINNKNILLKSVIEEIIYYKEKGIRNGKFELDIKLSLKQ